MGNKSSGNHTGSRRESKWRPVVAKAINAYWQEHHHPPTARDIMRVTGMSSTSVYSYIVRTIPDIRLTGSGRPIPEWVDALFEGAKAP